MRLVPVSDIASRTLTVPPMLTSWPIRSSPPGLRAQARCATTSAPATARLTARASRMSASVKSAALDQLSGRCRAIPTTSWPWLSNRAVTPRPSTPLAPVTAILTDYRLSFVVVHQRGVDQSLEVHIRDVLFRAHPGGRRLRGAVFGRQCEQQLQHPGLPQSFDRYRAHHPLNVGFPGHGGRGAFV